ncbi:MAG: TonB C-terminal domain-containing protein [Myxococcota bacterium]|jgi:hypothetical protein
MLHLGNIAIAGGPQMGLAAAGAPSAPHLGMPDPEDARSAWISASISFGAHALVIGSLAIFAWLNPDLVSELIPVQIVKELPGSNEEPAPVAPKTLIPRRAAVAPTLQARDIAQTLRPQAAAVSAETLDMTKVDLQAAPTTLEQRNVTAQRIAVAGAVQMPTSASGRFAVAMPVAIQGGSLRARAVVPSGPARIDTAAPRAVVPRMAELAAPAAAFVDRAASISSDQLAIGAPSGIAIETSVADSLLVGGGGSGGTGKAIGVARCDESAFVQRYYATIRKRTLSRWDVPDGTAVDARVILRFRLDDSGSASDVEFVNAGSTRLGSSAVRALREASPFPALDRNTRCISQNELRATFSVPRD